MLASSLSRLSHSTLIRMAATASKPVVWIRSLYKDDPDKSFLPAWEDTARQLFQLVTYDDIKQDASKAASAKGAIVFFRAMSSLEEQMPLMPDLKFVANFGVGVDALNFPLFRERGIKASNTPDVLSDAVADMSMGLLLAARRDVYKGAKLAMHPTHTPILTPHRYSHELTGSTLGIVGLGSIGMKVAERARGFRLNILYHNRKQRSAEDEATVNAEYCPNLLEMLPRCDAVLIACPLNEATRRFFGEQHFAAMKTTATLVNIARGDIVDQEALVRALQSQQIGGAALDVTTPEPLPRDHPLLQMDNVIITPHYGSSTLETRTKMAETTLANLKAALIDNVPMPNEIDG